MSNTPTPNVGGRPPLPQGKARNLRLVLRVSQAERDILEQAARRDARAVSDWLRLVGLREAAQPDGRTR